MPIQISTTPADLARRIRRERERLRTAALARNDRAPEYTAQWVADMLGIKQQSYSEMEDVRRKSYVGTERLLQLAVLGYDLRRILREGFSLRGRVRAPTPEEAKEGAE